MLGVEAELGRTFELKDEAVVVLMASLLYGIGPLDLVTFAAVIGVFLGTAILATLLPAGRAARTDLIGVLRYE